MTGSVDYRYECGLDNLFLRDFPVATDDAGEEVVTIPHANMLHRVIAHLVASKPTGLQPKELRFLRTEMGFTQAQLATLVGKEAQTVARWEKGETPLEQTAEMVIRARALEYAGVGDVPSMEVLARQSVKAAVQPPYIIDASNPADYRPLAA